MGALLRRAVLSNLDSGIAVDANGNVYIADLGHSQIRVIYGGAGTLPNVTSPQPGYIYALTNTAGKSILTADSGDNGPAGAAVTKRPKAVAVDAYGNIFITENTSNELRMIYMGGNYPFLPSGATPGNIYLLSGKLSLGYLFRGLW